MQIGSEEWCRSMNLWYVNDGCIDVSLELEHGDWCCHSVGSDISARWKSVSKNDGKRDIQRDWQLIVTRKLDESFIRRDESDCIREMDWHFGERWWLCSSEWIDDANESLILANVGLGRCSNGLTVDLCRSVEWEFHQKRSKWLSQENVNWWNKAGWWFMVESWK